MPALNQPTILPTYSITKGDAVVGAGAQHTITEVGWIQSYWGHAADCDLESNTDGWQITVKGAAGENTPCYLYSDGTNVRVNNQTGGGLHPYWEVLQYS